jgi:CubicO group peptidase (beta-lactamase class C family)
MAIAFYRVSNLFYRGSAMRIVFASLFVVIAMHASSGAQPAARPPNKLPDYSQAIARLETAIREELAEHQLHGMSVALVDDQRIVYANGFGSVKRDSIFRAGSISKLLNAVGIMQQVEQGRIDLDAPIQRYGPQFDIVVPFANTPPITIRQLLCHRSGMIRESPVGGYFDSSEPGLAATVDSIRSCVLVRPPNTKTSYSNVGPSIAGQILATVTGSDYARYQQEHVLGPMGMTSSSYVLAGIPRKRLAVAYMQVADGRGGFTEQTAPLFDLGTIPAGNLFTSVEDLARFVCVLAASGRGGDRQIVSPASLAQMWTPQLTNDESGYGIGFMVSRYRNHKAVSHNGAVYGFSSSLVLLPEAKIGVVLLCNDDIVNGNVSRLSHVALDLMLEAKLGEPPTPPPAMLAVPAKDLAPFAGEYESASTWARLEVKGGRLAGMLNGHAVQFLPTAALAFLIDGRSADRSVATFERAADGKIGAFVTAAGQRFVRVDPAAADNPCPLWASYVGSYGPSFIPLVISIRNGHLYAMTENADDYRLTPVNRQVFAMPPGMYADEQLVFQTGPDGKVWGVSLTNMTLPRRNDNR